MREAVHAPGLSGSQDAPYDARTVANLILDYADELDLLVSQMILLKLIYFSHGWYLAFFEKPLVWNPFEAWKAGPVVKVVRDCFKQFGSKPINSRASVFDFRLGKSIEPPGKISPSDARFIRRVVDEYRGYNAFELSDLTHEIGSPWDKIWNSNQPIGRFALRLSNEEICQHFLMAKDRFGLT